MNKQLTLSEEILGLEQNIEQVKKRKEFYNRISKMYEDLHSELRKSINSKPQYQGELVKAIELLDQSSIAINKIDYKINELIHNLKLLKYEKEVKLLSE